MRQRDNLHKNYIVRLPEPAREPREALLRTDTPAASKLQPAHMLLTAAADRAAWRESALAAACSVPSRAKAWIGGG